VNYEIPKSKKDDKYVKYTLINHGGVVEQLDVVWLVGWLIRQLFCTCLTFKNIYTILEKREIA